MKKVLSFVLGIALLGVLWVLSFEELTTRETSLFSATLAILSMAVSWLITDLYAEKSKQSALEEAKTFHQENLKTYVINASEKVNNISNELSRLTKRLKNTSGSSENFSQDIIEERINNVIHVIETLKSVNDTTINDWRGIIGLEIKTFKEKEEEQKAKEIESLLLRIENLEALELSDSETEQSVMDARLSLDDLLGDTGFSLDKQKSLHRVTRQCPSCGTMFSYDQHTRSDNYRHLRCPKASCNTFLFSDFRQVTGKIELWEPRLKSHEVSCAICSEINDISVPDCEGGRGNNKCKCGNVITLKYTKEKELLEHNSTAMPKNEEESCTLSEEMILSVKEKLPPQPWERHVHKAIAVELNLSNSQVRKAIKELMRRGDIYQQIDGVLYQQVEPTA
ncbi:hypothetical protein [Vibrio parahaemolyticus]|uniref:hypothetical protein n=1 Tax=Vibrio parahaemolyticus TaxID=670 RepID=UPI0009B71908|nr:hypothetical protein [Vibrio parahaemolyticus]EJG0622558.1 hypothetical protein [Vibrio parahaemolyticus]EJG0640705.1 hypothetical protein [Vibrio parahaemolyticus]EJG0687627.1 hypothetical protein [Vibrio parahaemolyticus]EJG0702115.1 hypothetical protein [Vibrio parahaemolyticus]EJG0730745.1 hypothetical protein [Vibrio parahaemolyticus]